MEQVPIASDVNMDSELDEKSDVAIITPDESMDDPVEEEPLLRADDHEAILKAHMPEIPDLEVDTESHHTWDIEGWRQLGRREQGPIFHCGDDPWRVLFFPYGNNVDYASFYLEQAWEDKAPEDWYACVQFMLVLWNPNDPTIFLTHSAQHRFTADEGDWGFTRFAELRRLFAAQWDDRTRPMVENDGAKMTAYVRKLKDPTGVLWHNFVNYDSKKATGMVGMKNQGATCYLNSLLQSLYFTNAFRRSIYQIPTESDQDYRSSSAYALQRLFFQLQTNEQAVSTHELTAAFGWDSRQIFEQQDVQELSRILMEKMEEKMKGTEAENSLAKMFVGKMKTYISCINVNYESSRIEDFWDLQLNVSGMKGIDDSFKDYISVETMEGDNKYFAEGHGLQDAKKGVIFESFPEVLHLQLKRFEYDFQRDTMMKINDRYEFPEVWDAAPYLSEEADKSQSWVYHLHGVLVHSGDLNAGHYYAFLKPNKDGDFYKFDDDRVTRATKKEAMDDNFGGEYTNLTNGVRQQERNPYTRAWSTKRSMNAYMLVYMRESALESIFLTEKEVQPPPYLGKRFAEERELMEKRRKEREEAHLYMEVQVASGQQFMKHQGFDIIPWKTEAATESAPKTYRALKATPIGDFVRDAAADMGLDPDLTRAWVVVNRQNGTARPDTPIKEKQLTIEETTNKIGTRVAYLRLWLEEATDKDEQGQPLFGDSKCQISNLPNDRPILIFFKHFDAEAQTLLGAGCFYAALSDKVQDLSTDILRLLDWPAGTNFKMFEEIKMNMIEPMKPKMTLQASEIQEGDIICVQKSLSEKEIAGLQASNKYVDAPAFYDYMLNKIKIRFMPRNPTAADVEEETFELSLSKKMTYTQFTQVVGNHLNVDPTHVRLSPVNNTTGKPKTAIRYTTTSTLGQLLAPAYNTYASATTQRADALYYEVLEFSLAEIDQMKTVKFYYVSEGIQKEELMEILIPKTARMDDLAESFLKKIGEPADKLPSVRFFIAHASKVHNLIPHDYAIASLNEYATMYCDIAPPEEAEASAEAGDRLVSCFQFDKEPGKSFGVPFLFLCKKGERFQETRERLSKRTGIKGKNFEKVKWAVVSRTTYLKPEYLEDDDVLSERMEGRDDHLGMDHVNRKTNWNRADSIFIR